jgi:hypothetical protein
VAAAAGYRESRSRRGRGRGGHPGRRGGKPRGRPHR